MMGDVELPHSLDCMSEVSVPSTRCTDSTLACGDSWVSEAAYLDSPRYSVLGEKVKDAMKEGSGVQMWTGKRYHYMRTLEKAERNQGKVDLMVSLKTGLYAAVKQMPTFWTKSGPTAFSKANPNALEQPWLDVTIVKCLQEEGFPYACELFGIYQDLDFTYFAFSYANQGDAFSWCSTLPTPGPDREAICQPVCKELVRAVRWLHDLGIAHRDLSLENILMHEESNGQLAVKLIDFGMASLSRRCETDGHLLGKPSYQAPETHLPGSYDAFLADCFSLGVMLLAMTSHDLPWESTRQGGCELFDYVLAAGLTNMLGRREAWGCPGKCQAEVLSRPLLSLAESLLAISPRHRSHLGEKCFNTEGRPSVWDLDWLA